MLLIISCDYESGKIHLKKIVFINIISYILIFKYIIFLSF